MNYRSISVNFWTDSKVEDNFTPEDKYFYLYLLTNPHTNICGCYEISNKSMERETGYNIDAIMRLIDRMINFDVVRYSKDTKEILLLKWGKYNWSKSEKVVKAVLSVSNYIKNDGFRNYIIAQANLIIPAGNDIDKQITDNRQQITDTDVSIEYGYPMDRVSTTAKKKAKKVEYSDDFNAFWEHYPRQTAKTKAFDAWKKKKLSEKELPMLLDAIEEQKRSAQWTKDNGEFIPHPATWLNQERWNDKLPVAKGIPNGSCTLGKDEYDAIRRLMNE